MNPFVFILFMWLANLLTIGTVILACSVYEEVSDWLRYRKSIRGGQHVFPPAGIVKPAPPPAPPGGKAP